MKTKTWTPINADLIGLVGGAAKLTTPALLLDLEAMRSNMRYLASECARHGMKLRPHAKTHKCAEIAMEQLESGAAGVCCATPHEVIALASAGVPRLHLTTPVFQPRHFERLAALHGQGVELMVAVDHPDQIASWETTLGDAGRPLPVLVDIDIGMGRTGVASTEAAVELARRIAAHRGLHYAGVQGYSGMVQHINDYAERRAVYGRQLDHFQHVLDTLRQADLPPEIISGGGTGTFGIDVERGIFTESQAGSYIFMDVEYHDVQLFPDRDNPYKTSLFLRTSVLNDKVPGQLTVNAGFKSFATDGPLARIHGQLDGRRYELYGDEFGRIVLGSSHARADPVGSHVDLVTPHCDPTINLHDCYHVIEGDRVIDIWPIVARGVL